MYYKNLKLDIKPLIVDVPLPNYLNGKSNLAEKIPLTDINPELVEFLQARDITVSWAEIFHKLPAMQPWEQIHIDEYRGDFAKLNWIFAGKGSKMCWYEELIPGQTKTQYNEMNAPYIGFKHSDVRLVESVELQGPCIIQAGAPHNIIMGREHRHALSMVLIDARASVKTRLTMSDALERLSDIVDYS